MKPQSNIAQPLKPLREGLRPIALGQKQPAANYHYHAASGDLRSGNNHFRWPARRTTPSFHDLISRFGAESSREYVMEAVLFAVIVGTSIWPIFTMARAIEQLLK